MSGQLFRNLSLVFILAFIILTGFFCLYSLRANNLRMQQLRQAVFVADEAGKPQAEIEKRIQRLRVYVAHHMNTGIEAEAEDDSSAPIQLAHTYYRVIVSKWERRIEEVLSISPDLLRRFTAERQYCEQADILVTERISCILDRTRNLNALPDPPYEPPADYVYGGFESPSWWWDRAGASIILFGISIFGLILRLLF